MDHNQTRSRFPSSCPLIGSRDSTDIMACTAQQSCSSICSNVLKWPYFFESRRNTAGGVRARNGSANVYITWFPPRPNHGIRSLAVPFAITKLFRLSRETGPALKCDDQLCTPCLIPIWEWGNGSGARLCLELKFVFWVLGIFARSIISVGRKEPTHTPNTSSNNDRRVNLYVSSRPLETGLELLSKPPQPASNYPSCRYRDTPFFSANLSFLKLASQQRHFNVRCRKKSKKSKKRKKEKRVKRSPRPEIYLSVTWWGCV